jgi:hypothetical protein
MVAELTDLAGRVLGLTVADGGGHAASPPMPD